jgi:hypothetical protein
MTTHDASQCGTSRVPGAPFADNKGRVPTIVMMHGFPDSQHLYDLVIPALAQTRHVIRTRHIRPCVRPSGARHPSGGITRFLDWRNFAGLCA